MGSIEQTLCWDCGNAVPCADGKFGCSWSRNFEPVPGWTAEKHFKKYIYDQEIETYRVIECPEFTAEHKKITADSLSDEAAVRFRDAIVKCLVKDYRNRLAMEKKKQDKGKKPSAIPQENILRSSFFRTYLMDIDPEAVIDELRKEYKL